MNPDCPPRLRTPTPVELKPVPTTALVGELVGRSVNAGIKVAKSAATAGSNIINAAVKSVESKPSAPVVSPAPVVVVIQQLPPQDQNAPPQQYHNPPALSARPQVVVIYSQSDCNQTYQQEHRPIIASQQINELIQHPGQPQMYAHTAYDEYDEIPPRPGYSSDVDKIPPRPNDRAAREAVDRFCCYLCLFDCFTANARSCNPCCCCFVVECCCCQ